jgi:hypothetical protein
LPAAPAVLAGALATVLAIAGCGSSGTVTPAPDASAPACTALLGRLPTRVADQKRGTAPAAGAAGWGDPAIVLRCGLPPSAPTTIPCTAVNGVDWLFEDSSSGLRLTSYGRRPAVEVTVPARYGRDLALAALVDLTAAVSPLPVERRCS